MLKMVHAILLNDLTGIGNGIGYSRYIAPYILASKAQDEGFKCITIENFTKLPDLFEILEGLITSDTALIGISGTFLGVDADLSENPRAKHSYSRGYLWKNSLPELQVWVDRLRETIKRCNSQAQIVIGGTKALFTLQENQMRHLFDFAVIGKAEHFFADMLKAMVERKDLPFKLYEGAKYLHESHFGMAKIDKFAQVEWQESDVILPSEALPLELAKGCSYNCKFCNYEKQGSIKKDLELLREELIRNYELFGTSCYHFCDDCFNDTRPKVEEFCTMFLGLPFKIDWVSYARVDIAVKFPHTLDLMMDSGARGLFWGIETLNHKIAKSIGKGTDPELVKAMLIGLKQKYGDQVISMGSFILGLPGETEQSMNETANWILESKALDISWFSPLSLRPYAEKLDKAVIDYADFSRNPKKYGFKEVRFDPTYYWSHETMDSTRCLEFKWELEERFQQHGRNLSVVGCVFQYPHLRSLGYSHNEIAEAVREAHWFGPFHEDVQSRQKLWLEMYSAKLKEKLLIPFSNRPLPEVG